MKSTPFYLTNLSDRVKEKQVRHKLGYSNYDKYGRDIDNSPTEHLERYQKLASAPDCYKEAKSRSNNFRVLEFEEAGEIIRLICSTLGKKPDIHHNKYHGSQAFMPHRSVIWGMSFEDGVEVSKVLVAKNFKEFRITKNNWLHIHIPRWCKLDSFMHSDHPDKWLEAEEKSHATASQLKEEKRVAIEKIKEDRKKAQEVINCMHRLANSVKCPYTMDAGQQHGSISGRMFSHCLVKNKIFFPCDNHIQVYISMKNMFSEVFGNAEEYEVWR